MRKEENQAVLKHSGSLNFEQRRIIDRAISFKLLKSFPLLACNFEEKILSKLSEAMNMFEIDSKEVKDSHNL